MTHRLNLTESEHELVREGLAEGLRAVRILRAAGTDASAADALERRIRAGLDALDAAAARHAPPAEVAAPAAPPPWRAALARLESGPVGTEEDLELLEKLRTLRELLAALCMGPMIDLPQWVLDTSEDFCHFEAGEFRRCQQGQAWISRPSRQAVQRATSREMAELLDTAGAALLLGRS